MRLRPVALGVGVGGEGAHMKSWRPMVYRRCTTRGVGSRPFTGADRRLKGLSPPREPGRHRRRGGGDRPGSARTAAPASCRCVAHGCRQDPRHRPALRSASTRGLGEPRRLCGLNDDDLRLLGAHDDFARDLAPRRPTRSTATCSADPSCAPSSAPHNVDRLSEWLRPSRQRHCSADATTTNGARPRRHRPHARPIDPRLRRRVGAYTKIHELVVHAIIRAHRRRTSSTTSSPTSGGERTPQCRGGVFRVARPHRDAGGRDRRPRRDLAATSEEAHAAADTMSATTREMVNQAEHILVSAEETRTTAPSGRERPSRSPPAPSPGPRRGGRTAARSPAAAAQTRA